MELVKSLGANHVIDYTQEDFTDRGERYDLILDAVDKSSFSKCKHALTLHGTYVTIVKGGPNERERAAGLLFLRELIEAEKLKAVIDRFYRLEQIVEAHRYVDQGHKRGSVVVTVEQSSKT